MCEDRVVTERPSDSTQLAPRTRRGVEYLSGELTDDGVLLHLSEGTGLGALLIPMAPEVDGRDPDRMQQVRIEAGKQLHLWNTAATAIRLRIDEIPGRFWRVAEESDERQVIMYGQPQPALPPGRGSAAARPTPARRAPPQPEAPLEFLPPHPDMPASPAPSTRARRPQSALLQLQRFVNWMVIALVTVIVLSANPPALLMALELLLMLAMIVMGFVLSVPVRYILWPGSLEGFLPPQTIIDARQMGRRQRVQSVKHALRNMWESA